MFSNILVYPIFLARASRTCVRTIKSSPVTGAAFYLCSWSYLGSRFFWSYFGSYFFWSWFYYYSSIYDSVVCVHTKLTAWLLKPNWQSTTDTGITYCTFTNFD